MISLLRALEAGLEIFGLYYGTYRATVMDNRDHANQGRLMIHCPQVHGVNDYPRVWSWPIAIMATTKGGIWAIPDIGETVYVMFDHGRPEYPMWKGGWWGNGDTTDDMIPSKVVVCVPEGIKVVIDRNNLSVLVEQSKGNSIQIDDNKCRVTHNGTVQVDADTVDILSENTTNVRAQSVINLSAMDEVNILSTGNIKIDGADKVEVSSTSELKVAGVDTVTVESDTLVKVKSTIHVSIEAPTADITVPELMIEGNVHIEGNVEMSGNGNVTGSWYSTNNSAHHVHPVANGVAQRGNP